MRLSTVAAPSEDRPGRVVLCSHCGLEVPLGCVETEATQQFCCEGCRTVYAVIHAEGFERFYRIRDGAGEPGQQPCTTGGDYTEFDEPALQELCCRRLDGGLCQAELYLEGVHCAACVWLVERVALHVEGTAEARLDLSVSTVTLRYDPKTTNLSSLARALDRAGYAPHAHQLGGEVELRRREDRALLIRLAVAVRWRGM